jgi:hypothetical protein
MTDMIQSSLHPFLDRAAAAGVVSGCAVGLGPAFDASSLAVVAVTTLHEGREAVESRLQNARLELSEYDQAREEEAQEAVEASRDTSCEEALVPERQWLLARFLGWFQRRRAAEPRAYAKPDPVLLAESSPTLVSRAILVRKIREFEARSRELLGIEADYKGLLQAQYENYRTRASSLPLYLSLNKGGE